jgi:hypothetical protein
VAGHRWKRCEEETPWVYSVGLQTHSWPGSGRPGSGWPPRPTTPATLFFLFFSNVYCSSGFDFLIFFFFLWVLL